MKFKLDENFGARTVPIFHELGHDVETFRDERLRGSPDPDFDGDAVGFSTPVTARRPGRINCGPPLDC